MVIRAGILGSGFAIADGAEVSGGSIGILVYWSYNVHWFWFPCCRNLAYPVGLVRDCLDYSIYLTHSLCSQ